MVNIFELQTKLAQKFCRNTKLEVSWDQLAYSHGQTQASYHLFNLGKLGFGDKSYGKAVKLFVQAQEQNDGFYFSEAHTWEGNARIAQAKFEQDRERAQKLATKHIKKFEKDAAEAAPAFYDLGDALSLNKMYEKSIVAFQDYLQWHDKSSRSLRWETNDLTSKKIKLKTEDSENFYSRGKRIRDQSGALAGRPQTADNYLQWFIKDGCIYYISKRNMIVCQELKSGDIRYTADPRFTSKKSTSGESFLYVRK